MTTKNTTVFRLDTKNIYKNLLDRICDYMETGVNTTVSVDWLVESIKIMLAGKVSRENGGITVDITSLSEYMPAYDGAAFEESYAAAQSPNKIYL